MEVKVSNITRHADIDCIRNIFAPLGEILHIDFYLSPSKKDGSFEADIIFANVSEAQLALKMSRTELGDRMFTVEAIMNRFRFNVAPELGISKVSVLAPEAVKTILIRGLSSEISRIDVEVRVGEIVGERPLYVALYGKNILKPTLPLPVEAVGVDFDAVMAAVEFGSRSSMLRALLALRATSPEKLAGFVAPERTLLADEAWKTVDPSVRRPEQLLKLSIRSESERSSYTTSKQDRRYDDRRYEHDRRYEEKYDHRRSRSRDRRYRSPSRSRSPRSRRY